MTSVVPIQSFGVASATNTSNVKEVTSGSTSSKSTTFELAYGGVADPLTKVANNASILSKNYNKYKPKSFLPIINEAPAIVALIPRVIGSSISDIGNIALTGLNQNILIPATKYANGLIVPATDFAWDEGIKPLGGAIGSVANFVWDEGIKPLGGAIGSAVTGAWDAASNFATTYIYDPDK